MKTILVPVDLSGATTRVCAAASDLARLIGARLLLLHIVPPPPVIMNDYYAFGVGDMKPAMAAVEKRSAQKLRALARRWSKRAPVQTAQATARPVQAIVSRAAVVKAAYVVMGSHGHGAMFDLLVGSTTHGVLRQARCPVLVVPVTPR